MNLAGIFKKFFSPRSIIGLDMGPGRIAVVQITNTLKGPVVEKVIYHESEEQVELAHELKEIFEQNKFRPDMIISCVPDSEAVFRKIPVPIEAQRKLEKIVKYQTEPFVPFPIENSIVDFIFAKRGEPVTTVTVEKATLSAHLAEFEKAGIEPDVVGVRAIALFYLALHYFEGNIQEPVAILWKGKEHCTFLVVHFNELKFIRTFTGEELDVEQLEESLRLYQIAQPGSGNKITKMFLVGDGIPDNSEGLMEELSSKLDQDISLWRIFDKFVGNVKDADLETQAKCAVALGLALSGTGVFARTFDLRKEEFRVTSAVDIRKMVTVTAFVVLILIGVLTLNIYTKLSIQESRYTQLKTEIRKIFRKAFPDIGTVVKGQEYAQMKHLVDEETQKSKWLLEYTHRRTILGLLSTLTDVISLFPDVTIENFSVEDDEIRLDGNAGSFETVDKLKGKLSSLQTFETVKLAGAKMDKRTGKVLFNFGLLRKK